jgi:hypothetical protein
MATIHSFFPRVWLFDWLMGALLLIFATTERTSAQSIPPPGPGTNSSFSLAFSRVSLSPSEQEVVFHRSYTLQEGAIAGGPLLPGMRVISPVSSGGSSSNYYGTEWFSSFLLLPDHNRARQIEPKDWPVGVAYDSRRDRLVFATLGGEGNLLAMTPARTNLTQIASLQNEDLDAITYRAADDTLYATTVGPSGRILKLNANGQVVGEISLGTIPSLGVHGYRSELLVLENNLVVLLEPGPQISDGEPLESRIYLVDLSSGNRLLTYRKRWNEHPLSTLPPHVRLTSPRDGEHLLTNHRVTLRASASGYFVPVRRVTFFANGRIVGTAEQQNEQGLWEASASLATPGEYRLHAIATDFNGKTNGSTPVLVMVEHPPTVPPVRIIAPTNDAYIRLTGSNAVELIAATSTNHLAVRNLDFYANGQFIGSGIPSGLFPGSGETTFSYRWIHAPAGAFYLTAIANFAQGYMSTSAPVLIEISRNPTNLLPTVTMTHPATNSIISSNFIRLQALAQDVDGMVTRVEFFANGVKISDAGQIIDPRELRPPSGAFYWELDWAPRSGVYQIYARATDITGARTTSPAVQLTVRTSENQPPIVELISPTNQATFQRPVVIELRARASDPDGSVQSLQFFANGGSLGFGTQFIHILPPPSNSYTWALRWTNPPTGSYLIHARAVDNEGKAAETRAIVLQVREQPTTNGLPRVRILTPTNGAVFEATAKITVGLEASDPDGQVQRVELYANSAFAGTATLIRSDDYWTAVIDRLPAGRVVLTARAIDSSGNAVTSAPVEIQVGQSRPSLSATREVPSTYIAGRPLTVRISAHASDDIGAYAVEDLPPAGWTVSGISDGGVFDPATGKVKFGPFLDDHDRTLTYVVTPPANSQPAGKFSGHISGDGLLVPIGGQQTSEPGDEFHPADNAPQDRRITIAELTAYAGAWKEGKPWPKGPNPIPLSFVTRAGTIWRSGEAYHLGTNPVAAPMLWATDVAAPSSENNSTLTRSTSASAGSRGNAVRLIERNTTGELVVKITFQTPNGTLAQATEELIPAGWTVSSISHHGVVSGNTIRWGPFMDDLSRTLTYTATPSADATGTFRGQFSFDGNRVVITGQQVAGFDRFTLQVGTEGRGKINFPAPLPSRAVLEVNDRLVSGLWVGVAEFLPGISEAIVDLPTANAGQLFFRVRLVE